MAERTLILGCGYVGKAYLQQFPDSLCTSRSSFLNSSQNLNFYEFNLINPNTWKSLPACSRVLWTFPAATTPEDIHFSLEFYRKHLQEKKVIVLSSTSAYLTQKENELVTEETTLNFNNPRFFTEEELRKQGAFILHLSGIVGPDRQPLNWYLKNRVKYKNNILNFIHVDDIVYFVNKLFSCFKAGERFNLTSGHYKTHGEIAQSLKEDDLLPNDFIFLHEVESCGSKKVCHDKIINFTQEKVYKFLD